MIKYQEDYALNGRPVTNFTVTVYAAGTLTLSSLYSDNGVTTKSNPFTVTDVNGHFEFYAADGRYDYVLTGTGINTRYVYDILLEDPLSGSSAVITGGSIDGTPIGEDDPSTGTFTTLSANAAAKFGSQYLPNIASKLTYKNKCVDFVEAFIAAPAWAATTAVIVGKVVKLTTGELLICLTAGTTAGAEPVPADSGSITDGTAVWVLTGRRSKVASNLTAPAVSNSVTKGAKVVDRRLSVNPTANSVNFYLAGGLTTVPVAAGTTSPRFTRFTDAAGGNSCLGFTEFYSDAPILYINGSGTAKQFRVFVDIGDGYGYRLLEEDITANTNNLKIDWTSAGGRKRRKYLINVSAGSTGTLTQDVSCGLLDYIDAGSISSERKMRMAVFGDSILYTQIPSYVLNPTEWSQSASLGTRIGQSIGCDYVYMLNNGGTGYLTASTIGTVRTMMTLNPITEVSLDYVLIAACQNDIGSFTNAAITAEALLAWQTVRTQYPKATIIVVGPWNGRSTGESAATTFDTALSAKFSTWADANSLYISPMQNGAVEWIAGTGFVGSTNGTGNSDYYVSTDSTHPSPNGTTHLVGETVSAILSRTLTSALV